MAKQFVIKRQINVTGYNEEERDDWKAELDAAITKIKIKMRSKRERRKIREENQRMKEIVAHGVQQRYDDKHKKMERVPYEGKPPTVDESGSIVVL